MSNYPYETALWVSLIDNQEESDHPIWNAMHLNPISESLRSQAREYGMAFKETLTSLKEAHVYTRESGLVMEVMKRNRRAMKKFFDEGENKSEESHDTNDFIL